MIRIEELWSKDNIIGVKIPNTIINKFKRICEMADGLETGGVIFGYYSRNYTCANITEITDAPKDSLRMKFAFSRGIKGLKKMIRNLWESKRIYYLGEWHYHPSRSVDPSSTDMMQMKVIASQRKYFCPEPICIIVGQSRNRFLNYSCYVFSRNSKNYVKLS